MNPGRSTTCTLIACLAAASFLAGGCGDDAGLPSEPGVFLTGTGVNPNNNLSGIVTFVSRGMDEARVLTWTGTEPPRATPFRPVHDGVNTLVTLGLEPDTDVWHQVEARDGGGEPTLTTPPVIIRTGDLPAPLEAMALRTTGTPSPGYLSATLDGYLVAYDERGRVRWYVASDAYRAADGGLKQNGNWAMFLGRGNGTALEYGQFLELTPGGRILDRFQAPAPLYTDGHELLLTVDGTGSRAAHFFSYTMRTLDFSAAGGSANTRIVGHQILRLVNGRVDFFWNAWDHFDLDEALAIRPNLYTDCDLCDFDHPNALWIDTDGNYLVSWAVLSEVTKIDYRTGEILWRLGGAHSDFAFVNDPWNGFRFQHYVRTLENGHLLLFDNGQRRDPRESRAAEYALDPEAGTATLVWEFRHLPPLYAPIVGSAQRLENGNTLVGFTGQFDFTRATGPATVVEVDPGGQVVWEATTPENRVVYRMQKVRSLYEYRKP